MTACSRPLAATAAARQKQPSELVPFRPTLNALRLPPALSHARSPTPARSQAPNPAQAVGSRLRPLSHPMSSRTLLSARASAASASLLRISPSLSAGPSSRPAAAAATSLLPPRRTASSSSSSSARPAAEPFQPRQNAAQEAARAQALRQAALDRMARVKLEELARTKRATGRASPAAAPHATASSSAAAAAATAGTRTGPAGERSRPAATDEPDRPHPTVERLKRERERKRQQKAAAAAAAEAEAEILHEKPVDRAPFQQIRDWYFGASRSCSLPTPPPVRNPTRHARRLTEEPPPPSFPQFAPA